MFSVLVLLEDSENVWSDRLCQNMANPAAKNRFFHFRHAVNYGIHWEGGGGFFDVCGFGNFCENIENLDFFILKIF